MASVYESTQPTNAPGCQLDGYRKRRCVVANFHRPHKTTTRRIHCPSLALHLLATLPHPSYILRVPAHKKPDESFKVGDRVTVSLSGGRIVDATVTAVVKRTEGIRLQVSYGRDETALVYLWQVRAAGS